MSRWPHPSHSGRAGPSYNPPNYPPPIAGLSLSPHGQAPVQYDYRSELYPRYEQDAPSYPFVPHPYAGIPPSSPPSQAYRGPRPPARPSLRVYTNPPFAVDAPISSPYSGNNPPPPPYIPVYPNSPNPANAPVPSSSNSRHKSPPTSPSRWPTDNPSAQFNQRRFAMYDPIPSAQRPLAVDINPSPYAHRNAKSPTSANGLHQHPIFDLPTLPSIPVYLTSPNPANYAPVPSSSNSRHTSLPTLRSRWPTDDPSAHFDQRRFAMYGMIHSGQIPLALECCICNQEIPESASRRKPTSHCRHDTLACTDCIRQWVETKADSGRVPCPMEGCGQVMKYHDVQRYASREAFARYDDMLTRKALSKDRLFIRCKNSKCNDGQALVDGETYNIITCRTCHARACYVHDIPWHEGYTCAQYDAFLKTGKRGENEKKSKAWVARETKACPKCAAPIQKNDGCDHMTCLCGHEFCWSCFADYKAILAHGNDRHAPDCQFREPGVISRTLRHGVLGLLGRG